MKSGLLRIYLLVLGILLPMLLHGQESAERVYTPSDVPNVYSQDSTRLVSDPLDYIPAEEENRINEILLNLKHRYKIEYAMVVVSRTRGDIESFSTELFRLWGLGDKKANDGLLFVLAVEDRKSRFEVGYGLEGYLTDATTSSIWRREMRPLVVEGQYGQALLAGATEVGKELEQQAYVYGKRTEREAFSINWTYVLLIYVLFSVFVFLLSVSNLRTSANQTIRSAHDARMLYSRLEPRYNHNLRFLCILCLPLGLLLRALRSYLIGRIEREATYCEHCREYHLMSPTTLSLNPLQTLETRLGVARFTAYGCTNCHRIDLLRIAQPEATSSFVYCPSCGGQTSRLVKSMQYRSRQDRKLYRHNTYRCLYCDHEHTNDELDDQANAEEDLMSVGTGMIIGSMLGGRRSYSSGGFGGFGGGSFGGGSSGGGGSTGSW